MALVLKDRVRETSNTAGVGNIGLLGAMPGFQPFEAIGIGNTTFYCITGPEGTWETGIGTLVSAAVLARTTVVDSSDGGSKVDFPAGSKDVFSTSLASVFQGKADAAEVDAQLGLVDQKIAALRALTFFLS